MLSMSLNPCSASSSAPSTDRNRAFHLLQQAAPDDLRASQMWAQAPPHPAQPGVRRYRHQHRSVVRGPGAESALPLLRRQFPSERPELLPQRQTGFQRWIGNILGLPKINARISGTRTLSTHSQTSRVQRRMLHQSRINGLGHGLHGVHWCRARTSDTRFDWPSRELQ